jgi:hypothetical protein
MLDFSKKKEIRDSALDRWSQESGWRSRRLGLTQDERDYLARYVRWERSLKRIEAPDDVGGAVYEGRPDPEFPWFVVVHSDPPTEHRGYLRRRGFLNTRGP